MNLITRLRIWFRRRRLKRAAKKQQVAPLREFVYLDEVSVYSLNASRLGSIAAEFSETRSSSLQSEVGASIGADAQGVAKAGVNSRLLAGQARESQVVRTAIVQTVFKEFYELELELNSFAMRPVAEDLKLPGVSSVEDLKAQTKLAGADGWIVDPKTLSRGRLLEVEVQLEADATFRVNTVISSLLEIFQENPGIFEAEVTEGLDEVKFANRIIEKFLVGLVPVRGRAVDYELVELGGREWIVHRKLLTGLEGDRMLSTRPLYVVGDAEQPLFWQDIRRVLFSGTRFRVLCRMMHNGLREDYTPVKLADVLGSVQPELGEQIRSFGQVAFAAMADVNVPDQDTEQEQRIMRAVLVEYAKKLAEHSDCVLAEEDLFEIEMLIKENPVSFDTEPERRQAFGKVSSFLQHRFGLPEDAETSAKLRSASLEDGGFDLFGRMIPSLPAGIGSSAPPEGTDERCLETEFVAIYW